MAKPDDAALLTIDGHEVRISHPGKLYFSKDVQLTKLDLVHYYLAVAPGALAGVRDRPFVLKRFVGGANAEPFYQKRAPDNIPAFVRTATLSFPSGRTAEEVVLDNSAALAWAVNLGCIELHPHPVRTGNLDHPDELRIDLDPGPGVEWHDVRLVALEVKALLDEVGLRGWPKTSGSRGMHINIRIEPRWRFTEVRRAALALARAVERRAPTLATSKWWKEERHGVFLDYNQNAKDRTTCSAYSVRPLPDARVSTPLDWSEVADCDPSAFTVLTVPARFAAIGDPHADMDAAAGSLDALLDLAARDESEGLGDAPWPPHFAKGAGEGPRVAPSRAKKAFSDQLGEGFGAKRFRKRAVTGPKKEQAAGTDPDDSSQQNAALKSDALSDDTASASDALKGTGFSPSISDTHNDGASAPEGAAAKKPRKPRASKHPLIIVSQSPDKAAAEAGLERWKLAHTEAAQHLAIDDILTDRMRGSAYIWYRIRVNLRHVPEELRPAQTTPDPDDDPTRG